MGAHHRHPPIQQKQHKSPHNASAKQIASTPQNRQLFHTPPPHSQNQAKSSQIDKTKKKKKKRHKIEPSPKPQKHNPKITPVSQPAPIRAKNHKNSTHFQNNNNFTPNSNQNHNTIEIDTIPHTKQNLIKNDQKQNHPTRHQK